MVSLQNLTIDSFEGFKFGKGFLTLRNLRRLVFHPRNGHTLYLRNDTFSGLRNLKITYVDISSSAYDSGSCVNTAVFSPFRHLRQLIFSTAHTCNFRQVLKMLFGLQGMQMDYLNLTHNVAALDQPSALNDKDIKYLSTMCIKRVDFSQNRISKLPYNISSSRFAQCLEEMVIYANYFEGYNIIPVISMLSYEKIRYLDFSSSKQCREEITELLPRKILTISTSRAVDVNFTFADSVRFVNFSLHGLSMGSPGIKWRIVGKRLDIVDLAYSGLPYCQKHFDISFVTSITNMNISGLKCSNLNVAFLHSIKTLKTLTCQDSDLSQGLKNDPGGIFLKGLFYLSYLDLGNNQLANLHENLLRDQTLSMRNLHLHGNTLSHIPKAIQNTKQLKFLNIKNNKLSSLSEEDKQILDSFENTKLEMSMNPFDCSCQHLSTIHWLKQNQHRIEDFEDIFCIGGIVLKNITDEIRQFELNCLSTFWLEFSASLSIVLIIAIIVSAIAYRYRVYIQYLYLVIVSSRPKYENENEQYEYDGFIAYSDNNCDWVTGVLYKQLTKDMNMKICLHHKDFIPEMT